MTMTKDQYRKMIIHGLNILDLVISAVNHIVDVMKKIVEFMKVIVAAMKNMFLIIDNYKVIMLWVGWECLPRMILTWNTVRVASLVAGKKLSMHLFITI